ncbi:hypothetical protein H4R20_002195 [Coemansia guatemalensis]|uniref:STAS domain-containing protein n=1 Tax=Coemansia guatemalensis TaxID=2761395 RepID=A0A9W8I0G8_9FUNG|nr:hypothetical protein H4R20_002195 [Coemansia guatemalensis]
MPQSESRANSSHADATAQNSGETTPLLASGRLLPTESSEPLLPAPSQTPPTRRSGTQSGRRRQRQQQNDRTLKVDRKWWSQRARYYVPIVGWLPNYSIGNFAVDVKAGFVVACLLVPQALSYSSLTHLPPEHGLYAALVPTLVYGLLGTSRHLSMGPEALISVLTGTLVKGQLKHFIAGSSPNTPSQEAIDRFSATVATAVGLVTGLFTFALGIFRLGFLDSMISESSLRGFISGTAIVILIGQARIVLGIPTTSDVVHSTPWNDLTYMVSHLRETHAMTAAISLGALALLRLIYATKAHFTRARWLQNIPDTLVVVVLATAISWAAELGEKHGVVIFGKVDGSLPRFQLPHVPSYGDTKDIVSSGITITMIGVVESVIVAREYASRNHYAVSSNRELVALGVSNAVGAAFGAYPAFGSLSRSKLNDRAQARSQMSGIVTAILVGISLLGVLPYLYHLPRGVLAAIIVDAVGSLLSATPGTIAFLFHVQAWSDLFLLLFICFCSVAASVETGILLAVIISLTMVIKRSNMPRIKLLGRSTENDNDFYPIDGAPPVPSRRMRRLSFDSASDSQEEAYEENMPRFRNVNQDSATSLSTNAQAQHVEGVLIVRIEEPLYFANAGQLHARLNRMEMYGDMRTHPSEAPRMNPTRAVVFDLIGMSGIDGSALEILINIVHEYNRRHVQVVFVRVCEDVRVRFKQAKMDSEGGQYDFSDIGSALAHLEQQLSSLTS